MPERLSGHDIAEMNFHSWQGGGSERVAYGYGSVGLCGRIDDDAVIPVCGGVTDQSDQFNFKVRLKSINFSAE